MACYSNEQVKEARKQLEKITADKDLMTLIIAEEIDEMDKITSIRNAEERGKNIGKLEANKETAKKMLTKNIEIELIQELTGLSKEEILKIREENK